LTKKESQHVFAYSGKGEILVAESEGEFAIEEWEEFVEEAEVICRGERESLKMATVGA
jgi:hypothetical protein